MYIFCDTLYACCEWLSQTGKADLPKNNKKTQFFNYLVILGKGCPFLVQYVLYHACFFYFFFSYVLKKFRLFIVICSARESKIVHFIPLKLFSLTW